MTAAIELGVTDLTLTGDSDLVVRQTRGEYAVHAENLKPFRQQLVTLLSTIDQWRILHVPRALNKEADALSRQELVKRLQAVTS